MRVLDHFIYLWRKFCVDQEATSEPYMEQLIVLKLGKKYNKAVYCHPAYLTSMQTTSWGMLGWMKHKLKSRLLGQISITSDMQLTPPLMAESKEDLKSLLTRVKGASEKPGLKLNIQKTKIMASSPITSWQIKGENVESMTDFITLASKITADGDHWHKIKRCLFLGRKAITNLDSILKSRDVTLPAKIYIFKADIYSIHVWTWELEHKDGWGLKNWSFWVVVLEKTLNWITVPYKRN